MDSKTEEFIAKLRKARRFIRGGWARGFYHSDGCYCLVGAMMHAGILPTEIRVTTTAGGDAANPHAYLLHWNDDPSRTQAEVLACIDNSIAALEAVQ